jgi:hypothetical protein
VAASEPTTTTTGSRVDNALASSKTSTWRETGAATTAPASAVLSTGRLAQSRSSNFFAADGNANNNPYVSGSEALAILEIDKERMFLMKRSKAMEMEIVCTHVIAQHFHKLIKEYLACLVDNTKPAIPSEHLVVKMVQRLLAVRARQKHLLGASNIDGNDDDSDEGEGSDESELLSDEEEGAQEPLVIRTNHVNLSREWNDLLTQLVNVKDSEQFEHDPILLCRSMVAQLAHQFLFLRNVANRCSRNMESLNRLRTMDPHATKMGKAVAEANTRYLENRESEFSALQSVSASVISLPSIQ